MSLIRWLFDLWRRLREPARLAPGEPPAVRIGPSPELAREWPKPPSAPPTPPMNSQGEGI
jgi:hypothetical protein